jgi:hypothetical protein
VRYILQIGDDNIVVKAGGGVLQMTTTYGSLEWSAGEGRDGGQEGGNDNKLHFKVRFKNCKG